MASQSSPTPVSSSDPYSALTWDVFLSYRGPETGPKFTAHLYAALNRHGIKTYKDDYKLRQGEVIPEALLKAIKSSKIYIVVFSEEYASSSWCLDELVDIVRFHEKEERLIIPVFYHIDPSIVRRVSIDKKEEESSIYDKALQLHAKGYYKNEEQRVTSWLYALKVAANISGNHICQKNREEPDAIEKIVAEILPRTKPKSFNETTVGLDCSIERIEVMLSSGATKVGIYGMGGVGKTTLARAVFDKIHLGFKGSCFLANVTANSGTDEGMKRLQQQLLNEILLQNEKDVNDVVDGKRLIETRLKDQKILVVIDDLTDSGPFESLGVNSFVHDSVVIITTRHKDILEYSGVKTEHLHMVDTLGRIESLKLFQKHAFGFGSEPDNTLKEFSNDILADHGLPFRFDSDTLKKLSNDILALADGLPLALQIYGSVVRTKYEADEWIEYIEDLKETPDKKIEDRLVISYNAIDGSQLKKMFLDIACFFIGWQKERVFEILETYYPRVNVKINNLKGRCLLTIDNNELHMHDLLREMGRKVAQNKSPSNPAKHSRLWQNIDIKRVLTEENECAEMEAVEGIYYQEEGIYEEDAILEELQLTTETFKKMKNLRFLHLMGFLNPTGSFDKTFRDLRWLFWQWCPLQHFPPDFKPINLGVLTLRYSNLITMELPMVFQKLKILKMERSYYLETTPDFNMLPSLVDLSFGSCVTLKQIHRSIGRLAGLLSLDLGGCWELASLPETIGNLKALKHLNLQECRRLEKLPENLGNIESLESLNLRSAGLKNLPQSIHLLGNLVELYADFSELITLPDNICKLRSLKLLDVTACKNLKALPQDLGDITSLRVLRMEKTGVSELPGSIGNLSNLVELRLDGNRNLETLPDTICSLRSLEILSLGGCEQLKELPGQMWKITSLRELNLSRTTMLKVESSQIPISLKTLDPFL